MAAVLDTGIEPKTLTEYQDSLRTAFRLSFGESIDVSAKSPQGQFIDNLALSMSQADDAVISIAGAVSIFRAFASQLEGLANLLGVVKRAATYTLVNVTIGGTPSVIIPAGSRAKSDSGDLFALRESTQLDVFGSASAVMAAVEIGSIELLAGELTQILDVVPGWETVINPDDGTLGLEIETDVEYRQKYFIELFKNAVSVLDSITAAVSEQENVVEVLGVENDTGLPVVNQNITIDPHSIAIIVEGGLDQDIAEAIRLKKTGGTGTTGTTIVPNPPHEDIHFFKVDFVDAQITITTTARPPYFPLDGVALLKQRVFDYVNCCFDGSASEKYFETDGMKIAEYLDRNRLFTPVNSVPGHAVTSIRLDPGDVTVLETDLDQKIRIASLDDVDIVLL